MKEYKMEVDVTATAYITVEAENEEIAMEEAMKTVADMRVGDLKSWETTATVNSEKYIWTTKDLYTFSKVFCKEDEFDIEDDEINEAITADDIIFIGATVQKAYESFCEFEDGFNDNSKTEMDIDTFERELNKGYGVSDCIEIARLINTSNGYFYDKNYVK